MVQKRQSEVSIAAGCLISVVAVFAMCATLHKDAPSGLARGAPDSSCVGVVIVSSQEKSDLLAKLAGDYDKKHSGAGCIDVRVNTLASGNAEQALARGWTSADG